jgi:hypothetical protein
MDKTVLRLSGTKGPEHEQQSPKVLVVRTNNMWDDLKGVDRIAILGVLVNSEGSKGSV